MQYQIDSIDRSILNHLLQDARTPYLEIARHLNVSNGTIHQRIDKMKAHNVIQGSRLQINHEAIGLGVTVLLGIHIHGARLINDVITALRQLPEVVEAYYTSGTYALFIKIHVASIKAYHHFLVVHLQSIEAIRFTESFICLDQPIHRSLDLEALHHRTPQSNLSMKEIHNKS